jgi:hypothetical protein
MKAYQLAAFFGGAAIAAQPHAVPRKFIPFVKASTVFIAIRQNYRTLQS